jgi:hypothetical protein
MLLLVGTTGPVPRTSIPACILQSRRVDALIDPLVHLSKLLWTAVARDGENSGVGLGIAQVSAQEDADVAEIVFHTPIASKYLNVKKLTAAEVMVLGSAADLLSTTASVEGLWRAATRFPLDLQGYGEPLLSDLKKRMPRPILDTEPRLALASLAGRARLHRWPGSCDFEDVAGTAWALTRAHVAVWSVGSALITTSYRVSKPPDLAWSRFAEVVTRLRGQAREDLTPWIEWVLTGFSDIADKNRWSENKAPVSSREFWSQPYWTYHSFHVALSSATGTDALGEIASSLVGIGSEPSHDLAGKSCVTRIGLSAACVGFLPAPDVFRRVERILGVHTACWAAAITLDSSVSEHLFQLQFAERSTTEMDQEASQLMDLTDKVRFFLATFESVPLHLRFSDRVIWECVDFEWKFPAQRAGLAGTLDALRTLHTDLLNRAADRRLRNLNLSALAIAIAGGVASIVGVFSFLVDTDAYGTVLVVLLFLLAPALFVAVRKRLGS